MKTSTRTAQSENALIKTQSNRNSNVEILRIIAMLFVVLSHLCIHSGFDLSSSQLSFNYFLVKWGLLGNLGVDIYVMISGYFLSAKAANRKSLSKLFVQVWFYSIVLFLVCRFGFGIEYSFHGYLRIFLPTIFSEYWFFSAYIVLAILSPYLNLFLKKVTQKQLQGLLACMLIMWVVTPTLTTKQLFGSELPQFVMYYMIGAYFRLYPDNWFQHKKVRKVITICCFALLFLSTVVLDCLGTKISVFRNRSTLLYDTHSLLIVGCAVGLFSIAIYRKPFSNAVINAISSCTFGVYLIHNNPYILQILWKQLLPLADYFDSPLLAVMILGAVIAVFTGCTIVEFLRQKTVAKPMTAALDRCNEKIVQFVKSQWNRRTVKNAKQ